MKKIIIVGVVLISTFYACKKEVQTRENGIFSNSESFKVRKFELTSEECFRALFYGQGVFANYFPETQSLYESSLNLSSEDVVKSNLIFNFIVEKIKLKDPDFFNKFSVAITSKDRGVILEKLNESNKIIENFDLYYALSFYKDSSVEEMKKQIELCKQTSKVANSLKSATVVSALVDTFIGTIAKTDVVVTLQNPTTSYSIANRLSSSRLSIAIKAS